MKNALRIVLLFTLIIKEASCASVSSIKNSPFDESINTIKLLNPASYISVFGKYIKFHHSGNIAYTQHYNIVGDEMLTITSLSNNKFNATKFRVIKLDKKFLMKRNIIQYITKFTTKKGIYLGITPIGVIQILGDPYNEEVSKDGITTYRYKQTEIKIDISGNDSKSGEYKSEYYFYENKLIEFVFGF